MTLNLNDIHPGDTIVLEHEDGSRLVREFFSDSIYFGGGYVVPAGENPEPAINGGVDYRYSIDRMLELGWKLTEIRKPKPELPTEPGIYAGPDETAWTLTKAVHWYGTGSDEVVEPEDVWLPLTRLAPRDELVREILDRLRKRGLLTEDVSPTIFGVSP